MCYRIPDQYIMRCAKEMAHICVEFEKYTAAEHLPNIIKDPGQLLDVHQLVDRVHIQARKVVLECDITHLMGRKREVGNCREA